MKSPNHWATCAISHGFYATETTCGDGHARPSIRRDTGCLLQYKPHPGNQDLASLEVGNAVVSILSYFLRRFGHGASGASEKLPPDDRLRRELNLPVGWSQSEMFVESESEHLNAPDAAVESTERIEDLLERVKRLHALIETSRAHSEQAIQRLHGISRQLRDLEVRVDQLSSHVQLKTAVGARSSKATSSPSPRSSKRQEPAKKKVIGDDALDSFSDEASLPRASRARP